MPMRYGRILPVLLTSAAVYTFSTTADAKSMELENRLLECAETLQAIMRAPDKTIPTDLIKRSKAIIIFPSLLKAGFGVGGHYGKGVILRRKRSGGKWGPPAFISLIGGSFGWQLGVQSTEMVLLVMTEISVKSLFRDKLTIGADASIAAGPVGRDASAALEVDRGAGILSYSRAKGLFAGVSIKGSVLEPDWDANHQYYGSDVSIIDIFFQGKGTLSPAGKRLIQLLNRYSA
jgi:lipid-binding SYLF domain-containing protein